MNRMDREKGEAKLRFLDGISYKAVLERGFALVRGEGGKIRRRAGEIKAGEALHLVFADGEKSAHAEGAAPRGKKSGADQGSLF